MFNHLYILLKLYSERLWNYNYLSENPNILWTYKWLSSNPNITWQIIQK